MHALARQRIEVDRQCRRQRFALARAHLGYFSIVQGHTAQKLHIKMPHFHDAFGALPHHRKGLGQQFVQRLSVCHAVTEFLSLGLERIVGQFLERRLHRIDAGNGVAVLLEKSIIATAENFGKYVGGHEGKTVPSTHLGQPNGEILCKSR